MAFLNQPAQGTIDTEYLYEQPDGIGLLVALGYRPYLLNGKRLVWCRTLYREEEHVWPADYYRFANSRTDQVIPRRGKVVDAKALVDLIHQHVGRGKVSLLEARLDVLRPWLAEAIVLFENEEGEYVQRLLS